ncbi:MAG: hypothetical protein AAGF07_03780 [Patescibacteria group bacterium]
MSQDKTPKFNINVGGEEIELDEDGSLVINPTKSAEDTTTNSEEEENESASKSESTVIFQKGENIYNLDSASNLHIGDTYGEDTKES